MIHLSKPDRNAHPDFEVRISSYIEQNRDHIIADILAALAGEKHPIVEQRSRFPEWDSQVLATDALVNEVLKAGIEGVAVADIDRDELELFIDDLRETYGDGKSLPLAPAELTETWNRVLQSHHQTNWVMRKLHAAYRQGRLTLLCPVSQKHGSAWIYDPSSPKAKSARRKRTQRRKE